MHDLAGVPTLMCLPLELRLMIYELVLIQPKNISINEIWHRPPLLRLGPSFHDNDIVHEIFYKHNHFVYYFTARTNSAPAIQDFVAKLVSLTPWQRRWIRRVSVVCFWSSKEDPEEKSKLLVAEEMKRRGIEGDFGRDVVGVQYTDDVWLSVLRCLRSVW